MITERSPGSSVVKRLPASVGDAGDSGLIPGSRRSPGEGNGNSLQYSCLGNPMDRGAWWVTVQGVIKESDMTEHKHTEGDARPSSHLKGSPFIGKELRSWQ